MSEPREFASRGQSQSERRARELAADFVRVDERSREDLLGQLREFAKGVRFGAQANWEPFFPGPKEDLSAWFARKRDVPPHLALVLATLELYEAPRALLDRSVLQHLDHYYRDVLRFAPRPARADRAHVVFELKSNAAPLLVDPDLRLSAGKEGDRERIFAPRDRTQINAARVRSRRSVFADPRGHVRCAPVADSADGVGAKLAPEDPRWRPFGHADLPLAPIGFAIASRTLRLAEGTRRLSLVLHLAAIDAKRWADAPLGDAFEALLTGPEGWLGPYDAAASFDGSSALTITITLSAAEAPVVDFDAKLHGGPFASGTPVLQLLWRQRPRTGAEQAAPPVPRALFANASVLTASLDVAVTGMRTSFALENDDGPLDAKKPFLPFGALPGVGAKLSIGAAEALAKTLTFLELTLEWQGAPSRFHDHYQHYASRPASNAAFSALLALGGGRLIGQPRSVQLFADDARAPHRITVGAPTAIPLPSDGNLRLASALTRLRQGWAQFALARLVARKPTFAPSLLAPAATRAGFITLELEASFLHAEQRAAILANPTLAVKDPYTPKLKSLTIDYRAETGRVRIGSVPGAAAPSAEDFANADLAFFHVGPFGATREHGFLREQLEFVRDKGVALLPEPAPGELLLGVSGVAEGDSVTLYFEVAAGTADPDLPAPRVQWSVLCDDHWRPFARGEIERDTSDGLRRSGVVRLVLPRGTGVQHTWLPDGLVWLRAALHGDARAQADLLGAFANGVEVVRIGDLGSAGPGAPLPAASITKLVEPAPALKSVAQPHASFGAAPLESAEGLRTRASERLRHKGRCVSAWDYERIVLEAFPRVHTVKCVSHASEAGWFAPGHVLLVVTPDLRNRNGANPLEPKLDQDTLRSIEEYVRRRAPAHAQIRARNPRYQRVHLDVQVRLRSGRAPNVALGEIERALVRELSPWAFTPGAQLAFGGLVRRSPLIAFIDAMPDVASVDALHLYASDEGLALGLHGHEAVATRPDAILVSAPTQRVRETAP